MDLSFVHCREKDGYHQRLAALIAEVRRQYAVPTVMATDLLCLAKDLRHLQFFANRFYWAKEFHFDTHVRDR